MVVQYVEAPDSEDLPMGWPTVFLSGGITNCPDWQADALRQLQDADVDMVVFNPRRANFDITNPHATRQQVAWEFINIRTASTLMFWFCAKEVQPIALHELGGTIERHQKLVIGVDPAYPRRTDIELQINNARSFKLVDPKLLLHSTLEDTVADMIGQVRHEWALLGR